MGYSGTDPSYDVQQHGDPYFTYKSIWQIQTNLATASCANNTSTINTPPAVDAGTNFTIPADTAYVLKGNATDAENDNLTYCWEQNDNATTNDYAANSFPSQTKATGPNFRSFLPSTSPNRYLPSLNVVLGVPNGGAMSTKWEATSIVDRTLNFTLTVRDNNTNGAQTNTNYVTVTSLAPYNATTNPNGAGPFRVTSQASVNKTYTVGTPFTVTWNVNNTNTLPGSANVNIKLSQDSGYTYPITLLANTPNDGSETFILPSVPNSTSCRLLIEPTGNNYFAVNTKKFSITGGDPMANEDFEFTNFALFPNPNKGNFTLQFENPTSNEVKVNVYDMSGRRIFENNYFDQTIFNQNIQLNNINTGIYLLSITSGNQKMTRRIAIE
jgi:hypothetical protein